MTSRYDFMKESKITDIDNETFPDPLSVSYNDVQFTKVPPRKQLTQRDCTKFWLYMLDNYGVQDYDDILLNINGIPYKGMLKPGDILFNIDLNDLMNFHTQKLLDSSNSEE